MHWLTTALAAAVNDDASRTMAGSQSIIGQLRGGNSDSPGSTSNSNHNGIVGDVAALVVIATTISYVR